MTRLKNDINITEIFIIFPEHENIDITSNVSGDDLNSTTKIIIGQTKLKKNYNAQEILKDTSNKQIYQIENKQNSTIVGVEENNGTALKAENILVRKLNVELQNKNFFLKDVTIPKDKIHNLESKAIHMETYYRNVVKADSNSKLIQKQNKTHLRLTNK